MRVGRIPEAMAHAAAALLLVAGSACEGFIEDAKSPAVPDPDAPVDCTDPPSVGAPVPMRRLTRPELEATIGDVLATRATVIVDDETLIGYRSNVSSGLDTTTARILMTSAEAVAVSVAPALAADPGCAADCASWLLDDIGSRLFRRPIDAETRARFTALYDAGVAAEGSEAGVRWLLEGMLESPRFLYMLEATNADGRLDGYSVASRLSYALWGGPPDRELLDAAGSGALDTTDGVTAAAERMIDDPRLERGLTEFVAQWLGLTHLDDASARSDVAALPADTEAALRAEPVRYVVSHVRLGSTIRELLSGTETPYDPALDVIYGADVASVEDGVAHLDPVHRAGLLTLPGVLAALAHAQVTSPTRRGHQILANLMCRPPPPPPPGVVTTLPPPMPGATTRERLEAHFSATTCASCHALMDGIGLAFENYDWLGRYRETDGDRPIDATAEIDFGDGPLSVVDGPDLARLLSERREVAECMARHFSRFALGVNETRDFACTVEDLADAAEGPMGLRAMIVTYVASPWFVEPGRPLAEGG